MRKDIKILLLAVGIIISALIHWTLAFLLLVIIIISFFCRWKLLNLRMRFPHWEMINRNLRRNYPYILIGGSTAYHITRKIPLNNALNLTIPEQQYDVQYALLKQSFSICKEDGIVYLITDESELCANDKSRLLDFHYGILHPWLYPPRWHQRMLPFQWIIKPCWFLNLIGIEVPLFTYKSNEFKSKNICTLKEMMIFCKTRNLQLKIVIKNELSADSINQLDIYSIPFLYMDDFLNEICTLDKIGI